MILRTLAGVGVGAVGGVLVGGAVLLARHLIKPFAFVGWGDLRWPTPLLMAALGMPLPGAITGAAIVASDAGTADGPVVGAVIGPAYIVAANFRSEGSFRVKAFRDVLRGKDLWDVLATFALTHGLVGAGVAVVLREIL